MSKFLDGSFSPSREPLSLQVARLLRRAILAGELSHGEALPAESELASKLGVGRSTIREALRILQAQGLLTGGDTVTTRRPAVDADGALPSAASALEAAVSLGGIDLDELVGLRLTLEQAAMHSIAEQGADLSEARRILEHMRTTTGDPDAFHQADLSFHEALLKACGNRAFSLIMSVVRDAQASFLLSVLDAHRGEGVEVQLVDEHEAILTALEAGDGDRAAALLVRHLEQFYGEGR